jgi:hypothetical protein
MTLVFYLLNNMTLRPQVPGNYLSQVAVFYSELVNSLLFDF